MCLELWYLNTAQRFSIKLHLPTSTCHNLSIFPCSKWGEHFPILLKIFMLQQNKFLIPGLFVINCSITSPQNNPCKLLLFSNHVHTADYPAGKQRVTLLFPPGPLAYPISASKSSSLRQRKVMLKDPDLPGPQHSSNIRKEPSDLFLELVLQFNGNISLEILQDFTFWAFYHPGGNDIPPVSLSVWVFSGISFHQEYLNMIFSLYAGHYMDGVSIRLFPCLGHFWFWDGWAFFSYISFPTLAHSDLSAVEIFAENITVPWFGTPWFPYLWVYSQGCLV